MKVYESASEMWSTFAKEGRLCPLCGCLITYKGLSTIECIGSKVDPTGTDCPNFKPAPVIEPSYTLESVRDENGHHLGYRAVFASPVVRFPSPPTMLPRVVVSPAWRSRP